MLKVISDSKCAHGHTWTAITKYNSFAKKVITAHWCPKCGEYKEVKK